MYHLAPVRDKVTGKPAAQLFLDSVFRYNGLSETIVSDRDPRFTGAFWDTMFQLLGTKLTMSTADHPQTDGPTERVNRVLEDTLRSICAEAPWSWSDQLPMVEFALSNAVHASTGFTPFYLNGATTPPGTDASIISGGEARKASCSLVSEIEPKSFKRQLSSFVDDRQTLINRASDAMASAQDKQKEYSDRKGRGNLSVLKLGELVLVDTKNLPLKVVSSGESNNLKHPFIGPFVILARHGAAYTIDLPKSLVTHPTLYVGCLKRYHDPLGPSPRTEEGPGENSPPRNEAESSEQPELTVSKPVNDKQTGTHASHTKGMTPELGGQRAHGAHESHDEERPNVDEGPQGPLACQPERQPDHQVQAQGLSRLHRRDLEADGPRRLTGTPQSPDPKLRVQKDKAEKEPRTQTRARAPPALLDQNVELHYHVERVVRERWSSGKRQLLVKWRGYPSSQNTWESEDRLRVDCPETVEIWD
ncbi:Pol protein [Phytophthora palmivora]|uniref:Pol protein n=1 Tax=Phytophthora palmivora TaxID=4796 RepID=A0A2P4XIC0_9STRA|nr:Pol protein [Phytophthora palmivora]